MGRIVIKYITCFLVAVLSLTVLLFGSAMVPQEAIQKKMLESGQIMNEREQVEYLKEGIRATQLHYSADATWLSIAYGFDNEKPLQSTMWAKFCLVDGENYNGSFYQSVLHEFPGNTQYLRYWHGPAAILRVLHLFWNVHEIYVFLCAIFAVLIALLSIMLLRNQMLQEAIVFLIAMFLVSAWIAPLCLEYVWMFLIALVTSIIAVNVCIHGNYRRIGILFFLTGIIAAYLDFLTTETITLLFPLLIILRIRRTQQIQSRDDWLLTIKSVLTWITGFIGMWIMKWLLASIILQTDVMPYVSSHILERLGGDVSLALSEYLWKTITRNVGRLFFFDYGFTGATVLVGLIIVIVVIPVLKNRVSLRQQVDKSRALLFFLLGIVPYVRYLVLHNHSYGHYCFTYRAQAASIMALCFLVLELVETKTETAVK